MNYRNLFPRLIILALLLCSTTAASAWSRPYSPMSAYVRRATLIALVDAGPRDSRYQTPLIIREILKGEAKDDMALKQSPRMGPVVPPDSRGWAALFVPDEKGELQLLEAYGEPEQIEALRQVIKIAVLSSERTRLEAWRALLPNPNPLYSENFLWEAREMREPNNFFLLLDSLDELDEKAQISLVQLVGEIGDTRGLLWLLERMNAANPTPAQQKLARHAAHQLSAHFPGAAGVAEAFRAAVEKDHLKDMVTPYLAQRDPKLRAAWQNQTPYLRAQTRAEAGDLREARRLWLEIIEDAKTNDWTRLDVAAKLAKARVGATQADLENEHRAVLPVLLRLGREGDYLQTENATRIARDWHHSAAIAPLLAVLGRKTERILEKSQKIAFAALWELGPDARKAAADVLITRLESEKASDTEKFDAILIPLCWLGDFASERLVSAYLEDDPQRQWERLAPLRAATRAKDETAALIALLQKPDSLPYHAASWIVIRLGEKRDPRALAPLATFLADNRYQTEEEVKEAITRIGGLHAEAEVEKLLRHPDPEARRRAVDLIVQLQGARALSLLRRMMNEPDFGLRSKAIYHFAFIGTPDDLPVLERLGDYWMGDRANHYWVRLAITSIRSRHRLDVNGPI